MSNSNDKRKYHSNEYKLHSKLQFIKFSYHQQLELAINSYSLSIHTKNEKILALEGSSRQKIVNKFDGIALLIHGEMNSKASNLFFEIDQKRTAIWIKPSR